MTQVVPAQPSEQKKHLKMKILYSDSVQTAIAQQYADHLSIACRLEQYENVITCEDVLSYFEENKEWLRKYRSLSGITMRSTAIFAYTRLFAEGSLKYFAKQGFSDKVQSATRLFKMISEI